MALAQRLGPPSAQPKHETLMYQYPQRANPLRQKPIDSNQMQDPVAHLRSLVAGQDAPPMRAPEPPKAMGPYVPGAQPSATSGGGRWSGGPLGAVPSHHGWAGMQTPAQQWSLRLLGAFPSLRFSSGFRTPQQNAAANGHPNSGHMRGWKADFSGNTKDLYAAAEWAKRYGARTLLHDAGSGFHLDISWEGVGL
jgi:hypothetical protein